MSRAGVAVVLPHQLYQRGQFLSWPYAQKWRLLEEHSITTIVNMWHRVDSDLSSDALGRLYVCWHCSPSAVPTDTDEMIALAVRRMETGAVLVHCEAGRGRSVWFCARLVAARCGIPRAEAWASVQRSVPNHNLTPTLLGDLT